MENTPKGRLAPQLDLSLRDFTRDVVGGIEYFRLPRPLSSSIRFYEDRQGPDKDTGSLSEFLMNKSAAGSQIYPLSTFSKMMNIVGICLFQSPKNRCHLQSLNSTSINRDTVSLFDCHIYQVQQAVKSVSLRIR